MTTGRLVVVHNNIDQRSAIGKLAMWATEVALEANYTVIAVARDLDPTLHADVQHLPLHVPRAVFAYQWARALSTVKSALGSVPYELLHTYQAQLTEIADTWHVQFLTRAAEETGSLPKGRDIRSKWRRSQILTVAAMEDRYLRRLTESVTVLFPSYLMRNEFTRLYGQPLRHQMLPNPAPDITPVSAEERSMARQELIGGFDGVVVGYLGGLDDRKGWRQLVDGIANAPSAFLLFGGTGSEIFRDQRIMKRCRTVGYVDNLAKFLSACDVLAVPSSFDPFAMVVTEAAAHGIPSITTPMVGAQYEVLKHGAGLSWDGQAGTFLEVVHAVATRHAALEAGACKLADTLSRRRVSDQLRQVWAEALELRARRQSSAAG